jgi:hypothetical protein
MITVLRRVFEGLEVSVATTREVCKKFGILAETRCVKVSTILLSKNAIIFEGAV